jgi:hypothetical protein
MSSRSFNQHVISETAPSGAALGDEWNNPVSGKIYKRTLVNGVVNWLDTTKLTESKITIYDNNIDLSLANYYTKTITSITTLTVSNVAANGAVSSFILDLSNGGSYAITWWNGVKWASGIAPSLTISGRDILGFFTYDGGLVWNGLVLAKDIK